MSLKNLTAKLKNRQLLKILQSIIKHKMLTIKYLNPKIIIKN